MQTAYSQQQLLHNNTLEQNHKKNIPSRASYSAQLYVFFW